ncbi:YdcH family protein [Paraferrimonas sedimenticola]|uniref:DUF465 domain-containing protein n=1 Tax=Paraferrimonas sedimenticola TaxID=375674 RepID=A0AA37W2S9_9GAMM|nr:YdcH family protein [Paraferrimonas sedimenticola]GLP98113.1 hypothetical protein GCM10007895_34200 [Paraferrimonas sedimenticola]
MLGENHGLNYEYPQHLSTIAKLKSENSEFAAMAKEYHQLDHSIRGLENQNVPTSDENFVGMKARRAELRDWLHAKIMANGAG